MIQTPDSPELHKPVWKPSAILVFGILFSFLAAGTLNAISWRRCGFTKKFKQRLALIIVFSILQIILYIITIDEALLPRLAALSIYPALIAYFYEDQKRLFVKHITVDMQKASILSAIVVSIPCLAVLVSLMFFADVFVTMSKKTSIGDQFEKVELKGKDAVPFLLLMEDFEKAERILDRLIVETPDDPDVYANLSVLYLHTYRPEDAHRSLDMLAKLDPKYESLKELQEAYQETLNDPAYRDWSAGLKLLKEKNYSAAEEKFLDFRRKHPEEILAYIRLAEIYERTGRSDLAKKELDAALKLDPSNKEAKSMLEETAPSKR